MKYTPSDGGSGDEPNEAGGDQQNDKEKGTERKLSESGFKWECTEFTDVSSQRIDLSLRWTSLTP